MCIRRHTHMYKDMKIDVILAYLRWTTCKVLSIVRPGNCQMIFQAAAQHAADTCFDLLSPAPFWDNSISNTVVSQNAQGIHVSIYCRRSPYGTIEYQTPLYHKTHKGYTFRSIVAEAPLGQ